MVRFYYRESDHTYWAGDERWPSVTGCLSSVTGCAWYTPESRDRGILVHSLTERIDKGLFVDGNWPSNPEVSRRVEAYLRFLDDVRPRWKASEVTLWNQTLRVGGRCDRIVAALNGDTGVLDIKTGAPEPWHGVQLAGYNLVAKMRRRWCLYLQPNGKYKLRSHNDPDDYREFTRLALETWRTWNTRVQGVTFDAPEEAD